jgi:hypothetical protein
MSEPVSREEYQISLSRIHDRVDKISQDTAQIVTSARIIETATQRMQETVYGNGKEGLVTKLSNLSQKVGGIFWFGSVVIIALVGTLVGMLFKK